jgi:hypothetical protein
LLSIEDCGLRCDSVGTMMEMVIVICWCVWVLGEVEGGSLLLLHAVSCPSWVNSHVEEDACQISGSGIDWGRSSACGLAVMELCCRVNPSLFLLLLLPHWLWRYWRNRWMAG